MPLFDNYDQAAKSYHEKLFFLPLDFQPSAFRWPLEESTPFEPEQLLAVLEKMTPFQRHRLATLLGLDVSHPILITPSRDGRFHSPQHWPICVASEAIPRGYVLWRSKEGREILDMRVWQTSDLIG